MFILVVTNTNKDALATELEWWIDKSFTICLWWILAWRTNNIMFKILNSILDQSNFWLYSMLKHLNWIKVLYKRHEVCYKSMLVFLFLWRWSTNINDYKTLVSIFQTLGHLHTWFFSTLTKIHVLHISGKLPNLNVLSKQRFCTNYTICFDN